MGNGGWWLLFGPALAAAAICSVYAAATVSLHRRIDQATRRGMATLLAVVLLGTVLAGIGVSGKYTPVYLKAEAARR